MEKLLKYSMYVEGITCWILFSFQFNWIATIILVLLLATSFYCNGWKTTLFVSAVFSVLLLIGWLWVKEYWLALVLVVVVVGAVVVLPIGLFGLSRRGLSKFGSYEEIALHALEFALQREFSNEVKLEHVYSHFGDGLDIIDYTFPNDNDWANVLQFLNATPDVKFYHCHRQRANYYDDLDIDIENRLLQLHSGPIGGIGVPEEDRVNTEWTIVSTQKFMGRIKDGKEYSSAFPFGMEKYKL